MTVFISSCYITEAEEATHVAMLSNGQISYGKAGQVTTPKASPTATTLNYAIVEHGGSAAKVMDARGVNEPPAASQGMSHAEGQSTEAAPTRTETAPFNWLPFISFITVGVILFYRRFSPTLP